MATYKAPLRDMRFVLQDVFAADKLWAEMEGTQEVTSDLADAILDEGAKLAENLLFPLNRDGDEEGAQFDNGVVTTPKGFKEAFKTYAENGWTGLSGSPEYGGQGMPKMLTVLFEEMLYASNTSFALYPMLSNGATLALASHASDELKEKYLPKIYEGTWTGTMCLTEPHCGTDLGIMRTKAEPNDDGSYNITGTKIFITGGEHDLSENIVHLVLAKLPDAPAGSKGISLFLVPRNHVDDAGNLGDNNGVSCGSIEHKMGIKGSATCVMNFDDAKGWLIGEENNGLACMFTMMNYERLSIGIQGLGLGDVAYQSSLEYAKDRIQGRSATGPKAPEKAADPIIVHPDVRRMLLTQRAYNEAGRAFAVYVGMNLDIAKYHNDADTRSKAENLVALLTPVAKSFFSDIGFDNCVMAQQVLGGHGYIREWGMEQFVRDARIAQIYEGANGIQALDLMGRKVARNGAKFVSQFADEIRHYIESVADCDNLSDEMSSLQGAIQTLEDISDWVISQARENADEVGAASVEYLELFALTAYAYMWLKIMVTATQMREQDEAYYEAKLTVGRFFFRKLLPKVATLAASIHVGADILMSLDVEQF